MIIGAASDIGLIRENNQDSIFVSNNREFPLFIVADGMGGHKAGEIASSMVVDIIKEKFLEEHDNLKEESYIVSIIKESIKDANDIIYLKSLEDPKYSGMGTTITLAYVFENKVYIGHVGDSRAYFYDEKGIVQITEDHSLINELLKNGSITLEEAKNHPQRNMITRAVGTSCSIEMDIISKSYEKDNILLICSDGLSSMVSDKEINNWLKKEKDMKTLCEKLVLASKDNGGLDNISVVAIKFE